MTTADLSADVLQDPQDVEREASDAEVTEQPAQDPIDELAEFIIDLAEVPMSWWAVAALLESRGLRDVDAVEKYNKRSIFDLAQTVHRRCLDTIAEKDEPYKLPDPPSKVSIINDFLRYYIKGTVFALPMAGQIAAILVLRYSLWAWLDFSVMQASLVAIGTIGSFVITGGVVQAIGREGTFYNGQNNPILLEAVCIRLVAGGLIAAALVAIGACLLNMIMPYFAMWQLFIVMLYFCLLTPLWLILAILYMMTDNLAILLATLFGTLGVHVVMQLVAQDIHLAHTVGLIMGTASAVGWGYFRIVTRKTKAEKKHHLAKLPRPSILSFIVEPFVIYGTLYFTLLFVDRIVGWSASDHRLPVVVWFRTAYELGMDWGLLSLVLTFAVLEYTVNRFNGIIIPVQQSTFAIDYDAHNKQFLRFYIQQNIILGIIGVASIFLTYFLVLQLRQFDEIQEIRDFFASPITYFVFWCSSFAYLLLAFALLNALFFFSLAKPFIVVRCITISVLVDIFVGYILSRMISYEYAVFGLIAGCGVFAYLMIQEAIVMFRNLDYYYYSAF